MRISSTSPRLLSSCVSALALALGIDSTYGQNTNVFINEIYLDPPGNVSDATHEYIEIRGAAGMGLTDHYLIFIENEDNLAHTQGAGLIEAIFDLGAHSLGSNGFLTIRQKATVVMTSYGNYTVDPASTNLQNTGSGIGFGSSPATSSIGASIAGNDGRLENSGFTAMLIRNDGDPVTNRPTINFDLDLGNNGLDVPTGRLDWTILDSIGVFSEFDEAWDPDANMGQGALKGRVYAQLNFGPENSANTPGFTQPLMEPGATYVGLDYEIEYLARWGNSAGDVAYNWHASNLTDNPSSGFAGTGDLRQSGEPHPNLGDPPPPGQFLETNKGVAYGTNLTNTLGLANYPLNVLTPAPGDFDIDADVDGTDLTVEWQRRFGLDLSGQDFLEWQRNLGNGPPVAPVPEPATLTLIALVVSCGVLLRRRN